MESDAHAYLIGLQKTAREKKTKHAKQHVPVLSFRSRPTLLLHDMLQLMQKCGYLLSVFCIRSLVVTVAVRKISESDIV